MSIDKQGSPPQQEKLLFATDGSITEKHNQLKCRQVTTWGAQLPLIHLQHSSVPKTPGTSRKRRQKDCKGQRNRMSAMKLCLLKISEKLHP